MRHLRTVILKVLKTKASANKASVSACKRIVFARGLGLNSIYAAERLSVMHLLSLAHYVEECVCLSNVCACLLRL